MHAFSQWSWREANDPFATQGKRNHNLILQLKPDEAINSKQIDQQISSTQYYSSLVVATAVKKATETARQVGRGTSACSPACLP